MCEYGFPIHAVFIVYEERKEGQEKHEDKFNVCGIKNRLCYESIRTEVKEKPSLMNPARDDAVKQD